MKLAALIALLAATISAQQYEGSQGWTTKGTASVMVIRTGGIPVGETHFQGGAMVRVKTTDAKTSAFRVTVRYQVGPSVLSQSSVVDKIHDVCCSAVFFEVSDYPIRAVIIEEMGTHSAQDF